MLLGHRLDPAQFGWIQIASFRIIISWYGMVGYGDEPTPTCGTCTLIRGERRTIELVAFALRIYDGSSICDRLQPIGQA
jgi:hypothetical protein